MSTRDDATVESSRWASKKPYEAPTLTELGAFVEVTLGINGGLEDGDGDFTKTAS